MPIMFASAIPTWKNRFGNVSANGSTSVYFDRSAESTTTSSRRRPSSTSAVAKGASTSGGATALIGHPPMANERVEGVWGNREVPPHREEGGGNVGEPWVPPRERAEGERRSFRAQEVGEPVGEQREPERGDDDGDAGDRRELPVRRQVRLPVGDHPAPVRRRRLDAEAEIAERHDGEDVEHDVRHREDDR